MDIDGNDYYVWKAVEGFTAQKIVVNEYNPTIPECGGQPADPSTMQGAGLLTLTNLGKEKRYELICVTTGNAIFIDCQYFPLFEIEDNSPAALRQDRRNQLHLSSAATTARSCLQRLRAMALNYLGTSTW